MGEHVFDYPLREEELRSDVDIVGDCELFPGDLEERFVEGNTGVIDQSVDSTEELDCFVAERDNVIEIAKVGLKRFGVAARGAYLFDSGLGALVAMSIV